MVQFLSIHFFLGFLQFLLEFSNVLVFCVTLYKTLCVTCTYVCTFVLIEVTKFMFNYLFIDIQKNVMMNFTRPISCYIKFSKRNTLRNEAHFLKVYQQTSFR